MIDPRTVKHKIGQSLTNREEDIKLETPDIKRAETQTDV
jgi:hypothetical protein